MIVYPASLLLDPPGDVSLDNARICYQTWLRDLAASSVAASTTDDDAAADAVLRENTNEYWKPTALPATLTFDLGQARAIDYVGIAGHSIGSNGCAIKVETSDGSASGSPLEQVWEQFSDEVSPGADSALLFLDEEVSHRYLRLTITGGSVMPRLAVVYAGQQMAMPRAIYGGVTPPNLSRQTTLMNNISRGGQFLGQSYRRHGLAFSCGPWRHLDPDWVRDTFDEFVKAARKFPFFYAWRPSDWEREVAYAWATGDIRPKNMGIREFMEVSFSAEGLGNE
jgi:hypothetical protein